MLIKLQECKSPIVIGVSCDKLCTLQMDTPKALVSNNDMRDQGELWHRRMCHMFIFGSLGGTPSLNDRGFGGRSSTSGLVGLKPKLVVLHPKLLGQNHGENWTCDGWRR